VLLFLLARSTAWRTVALLIVAGPCLLIAGARLRSAWIDDKVAQNALGRGHFSGSSLKEMGAAVVQRDTATLIRLAPQVDVNSVGPGGKTLLSLAVDEAEAAREGRAGLPPELPVVRTLLQLGARPATGLEAALKLPSPDILRALLDAGADPNLGSPDDPVVFRWLSVMPLANLRLLAEHGLNLDVRDRDGTPLVVSAARESRWDLLRFLIEKGADGGRGDQQGRTAATVLAERMESASREGREVPEALARARAALEHPAAPR
jgi:ankyrin repeat protein